MSYFLVIFIDEHTKFDREKILEIISNMAGAYDTGAIEESKYTALFGKYKYEGDNTSFSISKDFKSISVEDTGKAALHFAFQLQQLLDDDLTASDSDYSFLCQLNKISTFKEFEDVVSQGIYMNEQ